MSGNPYKYDIQREKHYWEHLKLVAAGIVDKAQKQAGRNNNAPILLSGNSGSPATKNPANKSNYVDPTNVPGTICESDPQCYVPYDNPNAVYVIGFHPSSTYRVTDPRKTFQNKPTSINSDPIRNETNCSGGILPITQTPEKKSITETRIEGNDIPLTQPNDLPLTQYTEHNGECIKNGSDSPDSSIFDYQDTPTNNNTQPATKKPPTPYPHSIIKAMNEALLQTQSPTLTEKKVSYGNGTKTVTKYYTYTPLNKCDIEEKLNILISDAPIHTNDQPDLNTKKRKSGSTTDKQQSKVIRISETWERINLERDVFVETVNPPDQFSE